MQLTTSIILLALGASSVSAAVTPKHRRHQQFHEKKAVGDIVTAVIDGQTVHWVNEYDGGATAAAQATGASPAVAAVAATTTPAAAAAPAATSASSAAASGSSAGNAQSLTSYAPICGSSSKKRATVAEIAYKGNTGTATDYGCNLVLVDSSIADQYDYTVQFTSQSTEDQTCVCWNKIGEDGGINGWFGNAPLTFSLPVGSEQYVAIGADSQGGCSCGAGSVPKNSLGEWAGTWVEFDMANTSNKGYSGGDISAIIAQTSGMSVQGMQVCAQGTCSSLTDNAATVNNAYTQGLESADGIGLNLAPGQVKLAVTVGYQG